MCCMKIYEQVRTRWDSSILKVDVTGGRRDGVKRKKKEKKKREMVKKRKRKNTSQLPVRKKSKCPALSTLSSRADGSPIVFFPQ